MPQLRSLGAALSAKLCFVNIPVTRRRSLIRDYDQAHFVTAAIVEWLPLFTIEEAEGTSASAGRGRAFTL